MPFLIGPIFTPIYIVLDNLILVNIFGCGCVPSTHTNLLCIPFNANDLRLAVFSALTFGLFVWSIKISKEFNQKIARFAYCFAVIALNMILTIWISKTFMWA